MPSSSDRHLELAREDYRFQEGYRQSLFDRLKFLVSAATLLIAADISLMATTPRGWRWWLMCCFALAAWVLTLWLFRLVWLMHWGREYKDPKTIKDYVEWHRARRKELEDTGFTDAEAEDLADSEVGMFLLEDYAMAAHWNRRENLEVQRIMTGASRTVLFITMTLVVQAALYVLMVTIW